MKNKSWSTMIILVIVGSFLPYLIGVYENLNIKSLIVRFLLIAAYAILLKGFYYRKSFNISLWISAVSALGFESLLYFIGHGCCSIENEGCIGVYICPTLAVICVILLGYLIYQYYKSRKRHFSFVGIVLDLLNVCLFFEVFFWLFMWPLEWIP